VEETGDTIISFLKKRCKETPLGLIYKLFRKKKVKIDGEIIRYYQYRLRRGENIEISDSDLRVSKKNILEKGPNKSKINAEVIYEDENIALVLKPHGISMVELDKFMKRYFFDQNSEKYNELTKKYYIFSAVHRLDKLTKGLVIYAKNPATKKELYNSIGDKKKIRKEYFALCKKKKISSKIPSSIEGFL
jgi:23S rRNA pseudouridine955/2504/2580 synthase